MHRTFTQQNNLRNYSKTNKDFVKKSTCMEKYESAFLTYDSKISKEVIKKSSHRRPHSSCYVGERNYVYNKNHPACSPPQLFMNDDIRKLTINHSKSTPRRRAKSASTVYRFGCPVKLPEFVVDSDHLNHSDLTVGQKQYIWGIARCYSLQQFRESKQKYTEKLLQHQFTKIKNCKEIIEKKKKKENINNSLQNVSKESTLSSTRESYKKIKKHKNNKRYDNNNVTRIDGSFDVLVHAEIESESNYPKQHDVSTQITDQDLNMHHDEMDVGLNNKEDKANENPQDLLDNLEYNVDDTSGHDQLNHESFLEILCQGDDQVNKERKTIRPESAKHRSRSAINKSRTKQDDLSSYFEEILSLDSDDVDYI